MYLFQSAADLLRFVLKYKMVAVAMLNFIFVRFIAYLHVERQT